MVKKGNGIFTPFHNMAKDFAKLGKSAKKTATTVLYGASDYSPKVREILRNHGNKQINKITIGRTPVSEVLTKVLSTASSNFKENLNNMPYDELFHLFILVELEGGTNVRLEKNEVINADLIQKLTHDTELKEVSNIPNDLTLNNMLLNTKNLMGNLFFKYSARDNNCQDFILAIFDGSKIGNNEDRLFIKQDTKQLFNNTGFLRKFANTVTETGARFNALLQGGDLKLNGDDNGLTDVQIMKMLKKLKIPCHGCYVKDELKSLKNGNYIINLNGQSHWCALIKDNNKVIYFDSYGFPAPEDIEDLIEGNYLFNKSQIQGLLQTSCGYYCIALFKFMKERKGNDIFKKFDEFLNLFGKKKTDNEIIIKHILDT